MSSNELIKLNFPFHPNFYRELKILGFSLLSSKWAAIAECLAKQNVFPIFYDVDPSLVRKQTWPKKGRWVAKRYDLFAC